jgi:hypothetical protein
MKSLYESILDDEDTLISNSIKDSQDPLNVLISVCKERNNEDKILKKLDEGLFDDFLRDVISIDMNDIKPMVSWRVVDFGNFVSISLITKNNGSLFTIRYFRVQNKIEVEILKPGRSSGSAFNILQLTNYFEKYRSTLRKLGKLGFKKFTDFPNYTITYEKKL